MSAAGWVQVAAFVAILTALTPPLGSYLARVFGDERVRPLERVVYRALMVEPREHQDWKAYARSALVFSASCFVALYVLLRTQGIHPFNPEGYRSGTWDVGAFGITFADLGGGLAMLFGRYIPMVAALAVAGSLAGRKVHLTGAGSLRTDTAAFGVLLGGVIVLIALLNFLPALMLGPLVQTTTERLF